MFLQKVFVSHYCNVPFHVIDDKSLYSITLIEELFSMSTHLMRQFELSPFGTDDVESVVIKQVDDGRL